MFSHKPNKRLHLNTFRFMWYMAWMMIIASLCGAGFAVYAVLSFLGII